MKKFTQLMIGLGILGALMSFSGCSSKDNMVTPRHYSIGVQGEQHATNFGGIRKLCTDGVMYIVSYNGMTPAIDRKNGQFISCSVDEYGRVIALGTFGK
jgi:hypothetical protein